MVKVNEKIVSTNIKREINTFTLKKIFDAKAASELAGLLYKGDRSKYTTKRGNFKIPAKEVWEILSQYWDYDFALKFVRQKLSSQNAIGCYTYSKWNGYISSEKNYVKELQKLQNGLEKYEWQSKQGNIDQKIQLINRKQKISQRDRERQVKMMALNQLSITKLNTLRNDFIEYLLFLNNEKMFPTLKHSSGVDYFIDGVPFDQKVSKGLGENFVREHGLENSLTVARNNKDKLAISLFNNQDTFRFDNSSVNRIFIVFTDTDISPSEVRFKLKQVQWGQPMSLMGCLNGKVIPFQCHCVLI